MLHGISFEEGGDSITTGVGSDRILYFHDSTDGKLYRRVSDDPAESIVSDGIYVVDADFHVTGSDPLLGGGSTDNHQSSVTIFIAAAASDDPGEKVHYMQTTVTQRTLDI